ncbi:hypothetical protein LPY66_17680 [Dehalobacter sp. DCM]|uniref:hypothetical protein n=1 Tax=Dehalobacter sp. DCM TaxID=2907827 RepID=UPI003081E2D8|nr:hypothetical protein LPY66_17680 [Dehalobacter sp. DCM]
MPEIIKYVVILGACIQLFGCFFYIKDTLLGKTKPNKVTWLMWSIAPMIASGAAFSEGVRWAILPTFMAGFGPFIVFVFSFVNKNAYWKLGKFDYVCGVFSLMALILWGVTKEPWVAITLSLLSDGFAALPTLVKTFHYPETENISPYITGLLGQLTTFAALTAWDFASLAFPVYLIFMNTLFIIFICRATLVALFKRIALKQI